MLTPILTSRDDVNTLRSFSDLEVANLQAELRRRPSSLVAIVLTHFNVNTVGYRSTPRSCIITIDVGLYTCYENGIIALQVLEDLLQSSERRPCLDFRAYLRTGNREFSECQSKSFAEPPVVAHAEKTPAVAFLDLREMSAETVSTRLEGTHDRRRTTKKDLREKRGKVKDTVQRRGSQSSDKVGRC